jgi:two-component system response regulator FixJ
MTGNTAHQPDTNLRVALIEPDDHRRAGIAFWLASGGLNVQPFESVREFFAVPRPSGIVLIADEGNNLADLLAHPVSSEYTVPFIAYSEKIDVHHVVQAMRRGAIDYVEWPSGKGELTGALRTASSRWQTMDWTRRQASQTPSQPHALTKRELEVLNCLREGKTSRQAAEKLGISVRTVDIYCGNIRRKFGVNRISDAITIFNATQGIDGQPSPAGHAEPLPRSIERSRGHSAAAAGGEEMGDVYDGIERKALAQARLARLTKRETEVLAHVANGLSNWQIADQLKISRRTVETHRYNLLDKIEMKNMALAIRLAAEGGLV